MNRARAYKVALNALHAERHRNSEFGVESIEISDAIRILEKDHEMEKYIEERRRAMMIEGHTPAVPGTDLSEPKWDIWCEGYSATGERGRAIKLAHRVRAKTWLEAVEKLKNGETPVELSAPHLIDLDRLTYWNCKLFSTREEAERSFG